MPEKIDFQKKLQEFYLPSSKAPAFIDVPAMNFLMIDGHGDPNKNPVYQESVSALFGLAYAIKFLIKKSTGVDYGVLPLEGLWWVEDMTLFDVNRKENWDWTMMIMQPAEYVTPDIVEKARLETVKKKNPPLLSNVRYEAYHEGICIQLMHIGPYATEGPNIQRMHTLAHEQGYPLSGKHHEIYLNDPNRSAPEKLKTVLRQPLSR